MFHDRARHLATSAGTQLSEAREQIKALSLSLRENQSALEHSDARINALIKRNEELASSTFGHPSTSSGTSPRSLPNVKTLLPICMLLSSANMSRSDSIWSTSNSIAILWPSAPFGCCTEHTVSTSNCFVIQSVIHMRHDSSSPDSPVGNLAHCGYEAAPCSSVNHFYFVHGNGYLKFDPFSGDTQLVSSSSIRNIAFPSSFNSSALALPLTIFHNLILN
ncbi:hypothetical protein OSTOST_02272 [Ostertagia ostertagi]